MKKIYFLFLLFTATFSIKAQYTLTSAANPVVGDIEKTWDADTLTANGLYPAGGTNQIWNYSGIVISPTTTAETATYVTASSAPNASLFPSANIAKFDGTDYEMSNYSSSAITNYGTTNSITTIVYQNPQLLANLPLAYGTLCSDTYSATYTSNSTPVSRTGTVSTLGDGLGTLNLPGNKNYPNVLRIKLQLKQIENVGSFGSQTITISGYIYVSAASKFSLLGINVYTLTQSTGTTTSTFKGKTVTVGDAIYAGIKENSNSINFSIAPNPASGKEISLLFSDYNTENYEAVIYNALGQQVKNIFVQAGSASQKISLLELNSGLYYIKLKGNNREGIQKIMVD